MSEFYFCLKMEKPYYMITSKISVLFILGHIFFLLEKKKETFAAMEVKGSSDSSLSNQRFYFKILNITIVHHWLMHLLLFLNFEKTIVFYFYFFLSVPLLSLKDRVRSTYTLLSSNFICG